MLLVPEFLVAAKLHSEANWLAKKLNVSLSLQNETGK